MDRHINEHNYGYISGFIKGYIDFCTFVYIVGNTNSYTAEYNERNIDTIHWKIHW